MSSTPANPTPKFSSPFQDLMEQRKQIRNANEVHNEGLSKLDKLALVITDKVGTMGFFLLIFVWTVVWCGYNILASEVPALHLQAFDPFPAFVAYLLISNVIQILLMPLIMVGQNLQGHHSEVRAENDFEVNVRSEREVKVILEHLERQNELLIKLVKHIDPDGSGPAAAADAAPKTNAE